MRYLSKQQLAYLSEQAAQQNDVEAQARLGAWNRMNRHTRRAFARRYVLALRHSHKYARRVWCQVGGKEHARCRRLDIVMRPCRVLRKVFHGRSMVPRRGR